MINKKLILAGFVGCTMAISGYAQGKNPCRVYEFAELNTFSDSELSEMRYSYMLIASQIGKTPPANAREVQEDFYDKKNCSDEADRIKRILDSREKAASNTKSKKKS